FKQLTIRSAYTWSKNLDNVSEIFSTFAGGNSLTWAQNPLNTTKGEYSFSGLDIPHQWSILVTEQLPFFKEQRGVMGHILGGWGVSANYILASGQRYTPVQFFSAFATTCLGTPTTCTGTSGGNYYDLGFIGSFVGVDTARPLLGNINAPASSVGIFAGDACNLFGVTGGTAGTTPVSCGGTMPDNTLLSMTALGQTCVNFPSANCNVVPITKNDVRYIVNAGEAQ